MINKARTKVEECDPIAVEMLDKTSQYLEDVNITIGQISIDEYRMMRHQITVIANKFSRECSCIGKT